MATIPMLAPMFQSTPPREGRQLKSKSLQRLMKFNEIREPNTFHVSYCPIRTQVRTNVE